MLGRVASKAASSSGVKRRLADKELSVLEPVHEAILHDGLRSIVRCVFVLRSCSFWRTD